MLTNDQRDVLEQRLLKERAGTLEAIAAFDEELAQSLQEQSGELSVYRFHMADLATEAQEREQHFLLQSAEGERLYRIDAALNRLYDRPEEFGRCSRCGREIPFERLEVVPETELCADDQRAAES
jgi:RNA polymerase-binding transcription factor DksA